MSSNKETTTNGGGVDALKWILVFLFATAAVAIVNFNTYIDPIKDLSIVFRIAGAVVFIAMALGFAAITSKGKAALSFARESRMEIRKVVWPTRQETFQTTFVVLAVTVFTALILWGVDGIMVRLVNFITNL